MLFIFSLFASAYLVLKIETLFPRLTLQNGLFDIALIDCVSLKNTLKKKKKFVVSAGDTGRQNSKKEVMLGVEVHGRGRGPSFLAPRRKAIS